MRVEAINLGTRTALLDNGGTVPITNLLDNNGDETDCVESAIGFVAGEGSTWFVGVTADYEDAPVN